MVLCSLHRCMTHCGTQTRGALLRASLAPREGGRRSIASPLHDSLAPRECVEPPERRVIEAPEA